MKVTTEEWFFRRAEGFYVVDVPIGQKAEEHAKLNPGTLEIRRVKTGELLWGEAKPEDAASADLLRRLDAAQTEARLGG